MKQLFIPGKTRRIGRRFGIYRRASDGSFDRDLTIAGDLDTVLEVTTVSPGDRVGNLPQYDDPVFWVCEWGSDANGESGWVFSLPGREQRKASEAPAVVRDAATLPSDTAAEKSADLQDAEADDASKVQAPSGNAPKKSSANKVKPGLKREA
jgi:hypothetical protein